MADTRFSRKWGHNTFTAFLVLACLFVVLPARADLDSLAFMVGNWASDDFGRGATETWFSGDHSMAGMFKGELNNGRVIIEFMVIQETDEGVVLRWNHFNEDFSRWESEPIEHHLVSSKPNYAKFQLKTQLKGLPNNLIYSRQGDELVVWVGDAGASDQSGAFELKFAKVK